MNDDPEYQWIEKIRTSRASNEARQRLFTRLSGETPVPRYSSWSPVHELQNSLTHGIHVMTRFLPPVNERSFQLCFAHRTGFPRCHVIEYIYVISEK